MLVLILERAPQLLFRIDEDAASETLFNADSLDFVLDSNALEFFDCRSNISLESWPSTPQTSDSEPTSAKSAPPAFSLPRCFRTGRRLLQANGATVPVQHLAKGTKLRGLRGNNDELTYRTATVKAARVAPPRERTFAEVSLTGIGDTALGLTSDHPVLVRCGERRVWMSELSGELHPRRHQLFLLSGFDQVTLAEVQPPKLYTESCEVVEVELEDPEDAIFVEIADSMFAACFGTPPREPVDAVIKHGFIQVQAKSSATRSTMSDPSFAAPIARKLYRTISPPHDESCTTWCRYHLTGTCTKGVLCARCHHPDHKLDNRRRKGKPRRR